MIKPAMEALGPFPILQFFASLVLVIVATFGGMLWLRGEKGAKREAEKPLDAPRSEQAAAQLYFDGPLKAIFDVLHEIQLSQATNKLEIKDDTAKLISLAKHEILGKMQTVTAAFDDSLIDRNRELSNKIDAVNTDLREQRDMLVRLVDRIPARGK